MIIETNISNYITEEVLIQENLKEERQSIEYMSKTMNPVEQNYTIIEKEILTVIQTIKE